MIVVENRATQDQFLKARFVIFRCQKFVKKGYIEMTTKIYLETLKKCPGLICFPLLSFGNSYIPCLLLITRFESLVMKEKFVKTSKSFKIL